MAKTETPFFGLGASGSVGRSLTAQKRYRSTMLREKPLPTYRQTLPQLYQRWLYEDYAYLWRQQSAATQAVYRAGGSRFHLTGFQYWMKYQLTNLPDIRGYWKLDRRDEVVAHDSSRNANHGTVIGATPVDGIIQRALSFDGLNDYIIIPHSTTLDLGTGDFTIEVWAHFTSLDVSRRFYIKRVTTTYYVLDHAAAGKLRFSLGDGVNSLAFLSDAAQNDGSFHFIVCRRTSDLVEMFIDNVIQAATGNTVGWSAIASVSPLLLAVRTDLLVFSNVVQDNLIIYDRSLDTTELTRHFERSYPL